LFLALDLDRAAAAAVASWMEELARQLGPSRAAEVRLVEPQRLHVTIRFFGNVDRRQADVLTRALDRPWPLAAFDLALDGTGTFPAEGPPRVVWLGLTDPDQGVVALASAVQGRLREAGLGDPPDSRPLSPHLTVGRVRRTSRPGFGRALSAALAATRPPEGRWRVDRVTLYESFLSRLGPRYEARAVGTLQ
jgi:2'-5' RNA ligase